MTCTARLPEKILLLFNKLHRIDPKGVKIHTPLAATLPDFEPYTSMGAEPWDQSSQVTAGSSCPPMRAIYSGTQTGMMGPFPPSGKRVDLPFIGILKFTNGKISEMWVEWDNVFMLTQLGHFPPAPDESE